MIQVTYYFHKNYAAHSKLTSHSTVTSVVYNVLFSNLQTKAVRKTLTLLLPNNFICRVTHRTSKNYTV